MPAPEPWILLVLVTAFVLGGVSKGTIGLGFPLVAVPAVAIVVDPRAAVVAVSIPNLVINLVYIVQQGRPPADWRRVVPLLVAGSAGIVVGVLVLSIVDPRLLELLLGVMVLVYVATSVWRVALQVPARQEGAWGTVAGAVSGFLQGTTGAAGPPLSIYLRGVGADKVSFVYYITAAFTLFNIVQVVGYGAAGLYTDGMLPWGAVLTIPATAGLFLGIALQRRIDQALFNRVVLVALAVLGLNLVLRGLHLI